MVILSVALGISTEIGMDEEDESLFREGPSMLEEMEELYAAIIVRSVSLVSYLYVVIIVWKQFPCKMIMFTVKWK